MRVMVVGLPLIGHMFPLMPLAAELAAKGHDVTLVTGGDAVIVGDTGLDVIDLWPRPRANYGAAAARALALHPVTALRGGRGMADAEAGGRVFAAVNQPMLTPMLDAVRTVAPDVVVHEPYAAAAAVAAARIGVPAILHNIALNNGSELLAQILHRLGRAGAGTPPPVTTISICPPSLQPMPGTPMRPEPYDAGNSTAPQWLHDEPSRPRILVTRSTALGDGRNSMLSSMLRAAPHVDAEIVVVRPNASIAGAATLPRNVRTVGWIPMHTVLHTCNAIVNHSGAGSIYDGLRAGLPQLATPAPGDRTWNASLLTRRGVGLAVPARRITAAHLDTLVNDTTMAAASAEVADEIAAMPTAAEVSELVVDAGRGG